MKRNSIVYALALVCLVAMGACNRPASASGDRSVMDRRSGDESTMDRSASRDRPATTDRSSSTDDSAMTRGRSADTRSGDTERSAASDAAITTKVKAALLAEPNLKSTGIKVETTNGVVQLSGFVSSREEVDRAAEVARNVEDVKSVQNDLSARYTR